MNNENGKSISQQSVGFADTVQAIINRSCFIDYGIVQDIPAKGIVTVEVSVAKNNDDIKVITCVLANISSSTFTVDIVPEVGDKVLVVYPRRYSDEMFNVTKNDVIIDKYASGYNLLSGIAILMNQYRKNQHNNYIQFKDGELTVKLAYDENNDKNLLSIVTDKNGAVTVTSNTNNVISLDKDGNYEVKNSKGKVNLDENGAVTVTSNTNNVISLDKDGNYEVKNSKGKVNLDENGYLTYQNTDSENTNKPELKFTSSGFSMKDINGCTIVSSSTSETEVKTVINGNLIIKK